MASATAGSNKKKAVQAVPYVSIDAAAWSVANPTPYPGGQGESAWVNGPKTQRGPFWTPPMRTFASRPKLNDRLKERQPSEMTKDELRSVKWTLSQSINVEEEGVVEFVAKVRQMEGRVDDAVLANMEKWMPKDKENDVRAALVDKDLPEEVRPKMARKLVHAMQQSIIKAGKEIPKSDPPKNYNDTVQSSMVGWGEYATSFEWVTTTNAEGKSSTYVKTVEYRPRIVGVDPAPSDKETKFKVFTGVNEATGNEVFASKVEVKGADGEPLRDAAGKVVKRYVGPGDITKGCRTQAVNWALNRVYKAGGKVGLQGTAKLVYIWPPTPSDTEATMDGTEDAAEDDDGAVEDASGGLSKALMDVAKKNEAARIAAVDKAETATDGWNQTIQAAEAAVGVPAEVATAVASASEAASATAPVTESAPAQRMGGKKRVRVDGAPPSMASSKARRAEDGGEEEGGELPWTQAAAAGEEGDI